MEQLRPKRIDRSDLLVNPVFWAVHSFEHTHADNWVEDYFGLSSADLETFWRQELPCIVPGEPNMFPCYFFLLPLSGGYSLVVEYEAYPEDFGIAYYIRHPSWDAPLLFSRRPSAYDWPPFRWQEAVIITEAVERITTDSIISQAALPLIFPGVWLSPDNDLEDVRMRLVSAWRELRISTPVLLDDMVAKMVDAQGLNDPWREDPELGWMNNGWSYRNPQHADLAFFKRVKEFFAAVSR